MLRSPAAASRSPRANWSTPRTRTNTRSTSSARSPPAPGSPSSIAGPTRTRCSASITCGGYRGRASAPGAGEPILDQPPGDRIAARQPDTVVVLVGAQPAALEPARVLELAGIDRDRGRGGLGVEAEHDIGRERPGLRRMVMHRADFDRGFLAYLARDRVFETFPRFDKTGQCRIHTRQKVLVAPEQRAVAVGDQHDHRRVGARKMQRRAAGSGAAPDMAGLLAAGRGAADAAKTMSRMPEHHRPRQRQQRPLMPCEISAE